MSVFAKKRQLFQLVSIARTNTLWLTVAVWLAIFGSVLAFGLGRDFERPKVLCLGISAAMLLPRVALMWPTLARQIRFAVIIWLLALVASVFFALDPARALVGSFERSQGVFLLVCCTIFALAQLPIAAIIAPLAAATIVSGAWVLAQFSGIEAHIISAIGWGEVGWQGTFGWRAFASFGNPTALAGWLVMAIVVLAAARIQLAASQSGSLNRRLLDCALLFGACGLLLSGTRAAWIALLLIALLQLRSKKVILIIGLTALLPISLALFSFRFESVQARVELAGAALHSEKITLVNGLGRADPHPAMRFWFGTGPDLQSTVLERNLPNRVPGEMPDRAHQMFLDGYLSIGLIGGLCWLWLMSLIWRDRATATKSTVYALGAGLICWQFGFALSAEKALFALLLGSLYGAKIQATAVSARGSIWVYSAAALFASFALLSYASRSFFSIDVYAPWRQPERALIHFERARAAILANQGELALRELNQAVALDPWRADLARARTQLAQELGRNP